MIHWKLFLNPYLVKRFQTDQKCPMAVSGHTSSVHELQVHIAGDDWKMLFWYAGWNLVRFAVRLQQIYEELQGCLPSFRFSQQDDSYWEDRTLSLRVGIDAGGEIWSSDINEIRNHGFYFWNQNQWILYVCWIYKDYVFTYLLFVKVLFPCSLPLPVTIWIHYKYIQK